MADMHVIEFTQPLAEKLASGAGQAVSLYWLGQAGFVIDGGGKRIVIDPYLSDALARKYRDTPHPHERMAPAPLDPDALGPVDLVLCTHHHTDHMDGETLNALAQRLPNLKFVVPAATASLAAERIGSAAAIVPVDAGDTVDVGGVGIQVLRAAHEVLEQDDQGRHKFLGYGVSTGGCRIFHSGDTIPFEGQEQEIGAFAPDLALFPVNGRSSAMAKAGFAGNMTLDEAINLCNHCGIASMIAHHYGMFAFNTVSPHLIDKAAETTPFQLARARFAVEFRLDPHPGPVA